MPRQMRRMIGFALLAASLSAIANAHPLPKSSTPAPNAVLAGSPREISITFSEALVGAFSGLRLTDSAGRQAPLGPAAVTNGDQLSAALTAPLRPGAYTVAWRALGADSHHVSGRYSFTVK